MYITRDGHELSRVHVHVLKKFEISESTVFLFCLTRHEITRDTLKYKSIINRW